MATGTATTTRASTATSTLTKVVYVTRKVQADMLAILDTYGYFAEAYATQLIHDIRVFLDEEIIDKVEFVWTRPGSSLVLDEFEYVVVVQGIGLADERAGGIRYRPELATADFHVRVNYNARWRAMSADDRASIIASLVLAWGSVGQLDYTSGRWEQDRTYSRDGYGLTRRRFIR